MGKRPLLDLSEQRMLIIIYSFICFLRGEYRNRIDSLHNPLSLKHIGYPSLVLSGVLVVSTDVTGSRPSAYVCKYIHGVLGLSAVSCVVYVGGGEFVSNGFSDLWCTS